MEVGTLEALDAAQAAAVSALAARSALVDAGEPLAEDARLALRPPAGPAGHGGRGVRHVLARRADLLVGYAQARRQDTDSPDVAGELLVDPAERGRGLGARLAGELEAAAAALGPGGLSVWAHGDAPAAAALAARRGYERARELWHMVLPLPATEASAPAPLPDGVRLRPFVVGSDERAWLAVNARAFATHPEQGRWSADDLLAREREPWFDPAGLLLAVDETDELLGFHWTKRDGTRGEVYVVGVDPRAQGRGLGPALTLAGLRHLAALGVREVELYVDGDNDRAQRTYARLGFTRDTLDVQYRRRPAVR